MSDEYLDIQRLERLLAQHYVRVWRLLKWLGVEPSALEHAVLGVFQAMRDAPPDEKEEEEARLLSLVLGSAARFRLGQVSAAPPLADALEEAHDERGACSLARRRLERILALLSHEERTAFVLFELENVPLPLIARVCGWSPQRLLQHLRQARDVFRWSLKGVPRKSGDGLRVHRPPRRRLL